jgi:hypothetical protein
MYIRRKKPEVWGNPSSPIFPHLRAKIQAESSAMAKDAGPLGYLAARQTDRQQKLACLAKGKALPQRGNLKRELRSCWGSGERGSKQELPTLFLLIFQPNLTPSIKRRIHKTLF